MDETLPDTQQPPASPPAPRVLLIEDDPDTADLMAETLGEHFGAERIGRCESVAQTREANAEAYDIALCDYNLPDGTGFDALESILERRDDLPVIMVTSEQEARVAIEAIRRGAVDYIIKTIDFLQVIPVAVEKNLETARIRRDNARLQAALASSLAQLKRKNNELEEAAARFEELATTDALTGLHNRRSLKERLEIAFSEAVRYNLELSCLMIDLDGFKSINDSLGHTAGDQLLRVTGQTIDEQIRVSDIGARYGGDEFVVALPHTSAETAATLAERLIGNFQRRAQEVVGEQHRCAMSIGIASLQTSNPLDPEQLIAHADTALYAAKQAGRGTVMLCGSDGKTAAPPGPPASSAA